MKTFQTILALVVASLFVATFSFAGEEVIKLKLKLDGDMVEIEADDLEVGETRQYFTDAGKEVELTRTEDGHKLLVDGEEIELGLGHGDHRHSYSGHGGGKRKVIIHKEGDEHAFVHGDEEMMIEKYGDADNVEIRTIKLPSAADKLIESGVLDKVDPEVREEILEVLREDEHRIVIKEKRKRVDVDVDVEVEEEN